jgi:hypothetical protein
MAYLTSPGATAIALGVTGTKRDDLSPYLANSLVLVPNFIGSLRVGPEFSDSVFKWDEDILNPGFVTDTTAGGLSSSVQTMVLSANDAANIRIGFILSDISASAGGLGAGEQISVSDVQGTNIQIQRGYNGTTATSHGQSAVFKIVARPDQEVSGLNNDMSRPRTAHYNYATRQTTDVILSNELINRARRGYTVGINDEMDYQFYQRTEELIRTANTTAIYSRPYQGRNGAVGASGGDYSTTCGFYPYLDTTQNNVLTVGTVDVNWATQGYGTAQVYQAINYANKLLYRNGALPDRILVGPNGAGDIGNAFKDQIRLVQGEMNRGFAANVVKTTLGNELLVVLDGQVEDTTGIGQIFIYDSGRICIRPMADQFYSVISAPTFLDGAAVRMVNKWGVEIRNTGTDAGQSHMLIINANFTQN